MNLESYIPTRGTDLIIITAVSNRNSPVTIEINHSTLKIKSPFCNYKNRYYFKIQINNLKPETNYSFKIIQDSSIIEKKTSTLKKPSGKKIAKFGLLADSHINSNGGYFGGKRLYHVANQLCEKYIKRIENLDADFIVFPGDILDSGTELNLKAANSIISKANIPCYIIIGNHEPYGNISLSKFYKTFDIPGAGFYSITEGNYRFLFLNTPVQSTLNRGTEQLNWLINELEEYGKTHNILLFSHFSLILHPCVQGWKNDGLQQIDNYREVLSLLKKYPGVKAFIAGHKNVPSLIMKDNIAHLLTTQLIQAPCSYDIIELYEKGFIKMTYEIDEMNHYQQSRDAFGNNWYERYGNEESRNFSLIWE